MSACHIGSLTIGVHDRPFIIAEMSGNHNQSLERALDIAEAAAKAGVQALKLQTYTADTLTLNVRKREFMIDDEHSLWNGQSLYELYQRASTPWEWHQPIMKRANALGLLCFSTPFDEAAVEFLEDLDAPAYKIASFENTHLPLIRKVASTGKPVLISTGMATLAELEEAVSAAREAGCQELALLKCSSTYPAKPEDANVLTIPHLRERFGCEAGLSDHTMGIGVAVAAVAHGATVIEKHVTLRRADGGVDSAYSLEPEEMRALVLETERAWQSLGQVRYGATEAEQPSLKERRSLYIVEDMRAGDVLTKDNLRCIRPGFGLPPKYADALLGKRVNQRVDKGTPMRWELVST